MPVSNYTTGRNRSPHTRYCDHIRRVIGKGVTTQDERGTTMYFENGYQKNIEVMRLLSTRCGKPMRLKYLWRFNDKPAKKLVFLNRFKEGTRNFIVVAK